MGLREDAEAARLAKIERDAQQERERVEARDREVQERRRRQLDRATAALEEMGVEIDQHQWYLEVQRNGSAYERLLIRSEDGVWLMHIESTLTATYQSMWGVVDKCPGCERWIMRTSGYTQSLAGIGSHLATDLEKLKRHIATEHPGLIT